MPVLSLDPFNPALDDLSYRWVWEIGLPFHDPPQREGRSLGTLTAQILKAGITSPLLVLPHADSLILLHGFKRLDIVRSLLQKGITTAANGEPLVIPAKIYQGEDDPCLVHCAVIKERLKEGVEWGRKSWALINLIEREHDRAAQPDAFPPFPRASSWLARLCGTDPASFSKIRRGWEQDNPEKRFSHYWGEDGKARVARLSPKRKRKRRRKSRRKRKPSD